MLSNKYLILLLFIKILILKSPTKKRSLSRKVIKMCINKITKIYYTRFRRFVYTTN